METKPNLNIFDYTESCISGLSSSGVKQVVSIVALVLLGIFTLFLVWRMIRGFLKGSRNQLWSTGTLLVSIILTIFLTKLATKIVLNLISIDTFEKILTFFLGAGSRTDKYVNFLSGLPIETFKYVLSVPAAIIFAPILFIAIFAISKIIVGFISRLFKPDAESLRPHSILERISGLCLASVEAILIFSVTALPATSIVGFADDVFNTIVDNNKKGKDSIVAKADDFYSEYLEPTLIESPVLWVANNSVNDTIVSNISEVPAISSENVREEFIEVLEITIVDIPEFTKLNLKDPSDSEKEKISKLIDKLADNGIITTIVSSTVSSAANVMDSDTLGIKAQPPMDVVIDDVLEILKSCSPETFKEDLHLIKDVYFLLADEEILVNIKDTNALREAFISKRPGSKKTAVQKLIDLMNDNERTQALTTTLTKLSITMLSGELTNAGFAVDETYDNLKESMNEVLDVKGKYKKDPVRRIEEMTNTLDDNLKNNGINVERDVVKNIAEYIDENYSSDSEINDNEFNDILLSYYDAYIEYVNNGGTQPTLPLPGEDDDEEKVPPIIIPPTGDDENKEENPEEGTGNVTPPNDKIIDGSYHLNSGDRYITSVYTFKGDRLTIEKSIYGTKSTEEYTYEIEVRNNQQTIILTPYKQGGSYSVFEYPFSMNMKASTPYVVINGNYYIFDGYILNEDTIDPDGWKKVEDTDSDGEWT